MKKDKIVWYECPWKPCGLIIPESDERIQQQKRKGQTIHCPECGTNMQRRVDKS